MKRLWITILLGLAACARAGSAVGYENLLSAEGEPLRSAFNEAAGKVRAIFLASPV